VNAAIAAVTFSAICIVLGVANLRDPEFRALGWVLLAMAPVGVVTHAFIALRLRARERERVEQVFGPGWRVVSKDERAQSWLLFKAAQEPPVAKSVAPPVIAFLAPSDPTNPYSAPADWARPPVG
jgi:hypothetical protein